MSKYTAELATILVREFFGPATAVDAVDVPC
jgi:hypothetical protein